MSMSREVRIENMGEALRLMMEEAGDRHFEGVFINPNGQRYEAIQNTTWKELIDRYLIRDLGHGLVVFTGYGWRTTMVSMNLHDIGDFKQKLGILSAALKDCLGDDRQYPALVGTHDLATQTGLSWDFIVNALKSEMIEEIFKIKGADISDDRVIITVPIDYGHRPL